MFPNPSESFASVDFVLDNDKSIKISVFDASGKLVAILYNGEAKQGRNVCGFSTLSLSSGMYFVVIESDTERLKTHKLSVL